MRESDEHDVGHANCLHNRKRMFSSRALHYLLSYHIKNTPFYAWIDVQAWELEGTPASFLDP